MIESLKQVPYAKAYTVSLLLLPACMFVQKVNSIIRTADIVCAILLMCFVFNIDKNVYVAKLLILFDKCTSLPPLALKYQYVDVKYARQMYAFVLISYKYSFNTLPICALRNKVSAFSLICLTRSLLKLSFSPISSRLSSGVFIPKYIRMTCDSLSGNKSSA